jgi:hypothetical protein
MQSQKLFLYNFKYIQIRAIIINMVIRILFGIALALSIVIFPLYISLILALVGLYFFEPYYELIPIFFLSDIVYGTETGRYGEYTIITGLLAIILVFGFSYIRRKFIRYGNK